VPDPLSTNSRPWAEHFKIQSEVDLDFVIGQQLGWPIGMLRRSPPEFWRRVLAAAISYQLQLRSIDYALKRYVASDLYESNDLPLGDAASDYLRDSVTKLMNELRDLHTKGPTFGMFGAEITLYRVPHSLDVARMLSNRGLLLEVLPILRLCLEMTAWANVAFHMQNEEKVVALKAQNCIADLKNVYETAGKIYGYLSTFSHWGHVVHGEFLSFDDQQVAVLKASVRYRAVALALCLVVLDVFIEVVRKLYTDRSDTLVVQIQGVLDRSAVRNTQKMVATITELTALSDLQRIQSLLR
jgi:hypothetical protein